jgi:TPR repeat protein
MVQVGRLISPPPQVLKCGNLDSRFQAVDDANAPKSGGSLEPEDPRPPLGNFPMTHKTHLLLALIVWVGFAPYAWAEEKAAPEKTTTKGLREKAEKGDADAMFYLGMFYEHGTGVSMDETEAAKWFLKAAEKGHAKSQYSLGLKYLEGRGVPKDEGAAVKWLRMAAEQGYRESQFGLGLMYDNGNGVPKDEAEAVKWYHKAADQGHAVAQYNLGVSYAKGYGIPKDETEAVKWYRKAADQGDANSQHSLGFSYALGTGVPKDDALAYMWVLLAGAKDEKFRKSIPVIEQSLTPEQRAEGQKLAREFKPVVQK